MFWIVFIVLLPGVGTVFYLLLGKDYRSRRVIKSDELARFDALRDKAVGGNVVDTLPNDKYNKLASMMRHANDTPLISGNEVRFFTDFTPMFQSMLDDISRAKSFVHIQFYIVENDEVGHQLSSLLIRKAQMYALCSTAGPTSLSAANTTNTCAVAESRYNPSKNSSPPCSHATLTVAPTAR